MTGNEPVDYFTLVKGIASENLRQIRQEQRLADLAEVVRAQDALIAEQKELIAMLKEALQA